MVKGHKMISMYTKICTTVIFESKYLTELNDLQQNPKPCTQWTDLKWDAKIRNKKGLILKCSSIARKGSERVLYFSNQSVDSHSPCLPP